MERGSSTGPGPFRTRTTRPGPDGSLNVQTTRRRRKRLAPLKLPEGKGVEHARTRGGWRRLWAPRRLAWWIAVLFLVGSALFALGGFASGFPEARPLLPRSTATMNRVFFVGSLFFTAAAWLQWLEALNPDGGAGGGRWRFWGFRPRDLGYLACTVQLVGTLLFNLNTGDAFLTGLDVLEQDLLVWTPDVVGCVCFLVASLLSFFEVSHAWFALRPRDLPWWIAVVNLLGSALFMVSAVYAYVGRDGHDAAQLASQYTLFGALAFLLGSYLLLPEMFDEPAD